MLKHFYKTAFIALFGVFSFQESFAQCSIKTDLQVSINSPICYGATSIVTIVGSELNKTYEVFNGANSVSSITVGTGADLPITLNTLVGGTYSLTVKVSSVGCSSVELTQKAVLIINSPPILSLSVTNNSPVCLGEPIKVTIKSSQVGVLYQVFKGVVAVSSIISGNGGDLIILINTLSPGIHILSINAAVNGCIGQSLFENITVTVNQIPSISFSVSGDTICSNNPTAKITIVGSGSDAQYQMYLGTEKLLDSFNGDAGTNKTVKNIPTTLLSIGLNMITVKATVVSTCQTLVLSDDAKIIVNPLPTVRTPILIGDTVSLPASVATIKVKNSEVGVLYQAFEDNIAIGASVIGLGNEIELKLPIGGSSGLGVGIHSITVPIEIQGCGIVTASGTTTVVVKPEHITSIEDKLITSNFAVYPNPFSSEITITSKLKGQLKIQITDAIGNIVHQESISNAQDLKLNPDLKSGIYFLRMQSEGSQETVKLIKQ